MSQVEDLFEVYTDLPEVPRHELCALAVKLCDDGDPLLEALQARNETSIVVSDEVVEFLAPLIDKRFPDRPLAWHFARARARQQHEMSPALERDAATALETAPALIENVAKDAHGFLLDDLLVGRQSPWVITHLEEEFCPAALEVVAYSRRLAPTTLPRSLAEAAVREAMLRIDAIGVRDDDMERLCLPASHRDAIVLARWIGEVLQSRNDAAFLLAGVSLPLPTIISTSPRVIHIEDDVFEVDGERWVEEEVGSVLGREYAQMARLAPEMPIDSTLCDLRSVRFPKDPHEAGDAALALVKSQPGFIGRVVCALGSFGDGLTSEQLVALAGADKWLLASVAERWPKALEGAAELVDAAMTLEDMAKRLDALLAIGAPAQEALATTTRALLVSDANSDHDSPLTRIADSSPLLNLSFWEKQVTKPGVYKALRRSRRLDAYWKLRPQRLVRAMKMLVKQSQVQDALAMLVWLFWNARPALREATPVVIPLVDLALNEKWSGDSALILLACLDTPEAHDAAKALLDRVDLTPEDALEAAVHHDLLWELIAGRGLVDAEDVLRRCYRGSTRGLQVTRAAARALVEFILESGLGELAEAAVSEPRLLAEAVFWHRSDEEAQRIGELLPGFEKIRFGNDMISILGSPPEDSVPRWLDALLYDDRATLLAEIGALCAAHLDQTGWANSIPKLLGNALRARCRVVLGEPGERVLQHLGEGWPTRSAIEGAAEALDLELDPKDLDRCADEGLPPFFRAVVAVLPGDISDRDDLVKSSPEAWLDWILGKCWAEEPALVARHLVGELSADRPLPWLRGVALALVALREPVGTTVPDALTRLAHELPEVQDFLIRQRDTFARDSAAAERAKPGAYRTRQAQVRLRRAARETTRASRQP